MQPTKPLNDEKLSTEEMSLEEYIEKNRPAFNLMVMIGIASSVVITTSIAIIIRNIFNF